MALSPSSDPARTSGRSLLVEVCIPVALGLLVLVAFLEVGETSVERLGGPAGLAKVATVLVVTMGIGLWVAWVLRDTALGSLERLRSGLRALEEGDFDAHIEPEGAREFRALAESFNRSVTFLGHQRSRLKALASTDALTGLAHHRTLHEELRSHLEAVTAGERRLGVVALSLDGFKRVNDERGHARGDEVLKAVADALRGAVREGDTVARLGGDEFVLVLRDAESSRARELAEAARAAIVRALPDELGVGASAGYVCCPEQAGPEADVVELAVAALRVAKRAGGARTERYDADEAATLPTLRAERLAIEGLLALSEPVTPVFQPIVEMGTGTVVGYEALSRFSADGIEPRSPDAWFNQAARVGLGPQLEAIALTAALRAPERPAGTYLSLNCTPSGISSSLVRSSLPRDLTDVVIEITEHELAPEDGAFELGLADLRGRGARIAIDDAGAGYAGLQQVMRVQPDIIKLDRSLVSDVDSDSARAALIEFFIVFAKRIGASVCTEGIETPQELGALVRLGVVLGQGYLLGRPAEPWTPLTPAAAAAFAGLRAGAVAGPGPTPRAGGPQRVVGGGRRGARGVVRR